MTLVVPNVGEVKALELILERPLTLKLFANDVIPAEDTTAGSFTEVSGGGYSDYDMDSGDWTISAGNPSAGEQPPHEFSFSGPTGGSGVIYGYYVVDADGVLMWAERFEEAVIPFTPINGSVVVVTARFEAS